MRAFLKSFILLYWLPGNVFAFCTAICMQKFHRSISQVTGSTEKLTLFAPFHTIIGASEDNSGALKNIKRICSSVRAWESCVRSCSRDDAREILLSSMNQWKNFCAIVRKPSRDTDEYFNCERENQQYVSQNCQRFHPVTYSITQFCKSVEKYRNCVSRYVPQCSENALRIKSEIDTAVEASFVKIMRFSANKVRIPHKCNMWHRPRTREKPTKEDFPAIPTKSYPTTTKATTVVQKENLAPSTTEQTVALSTVCPCNQTAAGSRPECLENAQFAAHSNNSNSSLLIIIPYLLIHRLLYWQRNA